MEINQLNIPEGEVNNIISYNKFDNSNRLLSSEVSFKNVIGLEKQKKELSLVVDWFKNSELLKEHNLSIPKGIILYGKPGNGKTLLIREIISSVNVPTFIFQGEGTNIVNEIYDVFKKARECEKAIVILDEIDLLIGDDKRVIRALQENMDGVEKSDNILVIAATNYIDDIPDALLRNGRFDKKVKVTSPTKEECFLMLVKYFKDYGVILPEEFEYEDLDISLNGVNCSTVKAIVNDCILRNGIDNITVDNIEDSISNITNNVISRDYEDTIETATHEAAHAVIANLYKDYFYINRLNINGASGLFKLGEVNESDQSYDKELALVNVSLAGNIAEKVICHKGSTGSQSDLENARHILYKLVNICGYHKCYYQLPTGGPQTRRETFIIQNRNEKVIYKLFKKKEKEVYKLVKKNKDKINALALKLYEKKNLKSKEIHAIID